MSVLKKTLIISIIFSIIFCVFYLLKNNVYAQTTSDDINSIDETKYPGIKEKIKSLQSAHPNWKFKILYTGLDWNDVISNEYFHTSGEKVPRNMVQAYYSPNDKDWVCPICGDNKHYDNGSWRCASESAIAYMMDPRNSLNDSDIFQFEELTYNASTQTINGVKSMTNGTFIAGDATANSILTGAKNSNMNAYFIVARIKQEQGTKGGTTVSGTYPGYEGLYNVFNIGASGSSKTGVVTNALSYAREQGWTTIGKSIEGGMTFLKNQYINKGQNTLYLQKFDVEDTDGLYFHQYMQNLTASQSEGNTMRKIYRDTGKIEDSHTFIIPVYENMPVGKSTRPTSTSSNATNNEFYVQYKSHVQDTGWETSWKTDSITSGTMGENKKIEAIQMQLVNAPDGIDIKYRTYVENVGWQDAVDAGQTAGTTGKNQKIYALRISLENTDKYSIMYRVHLEDKGWQPWTYDGNIAGSITDNKKIEAIQVKIVNKTNNSNMGLSYNSYVQDKGWQGAVSTGELSGTTGQGKKIEAMQINLTNTSAQTSIKYSMYLDGMGWQEEKQDGEIAGQVDKNQKIYGVKLELENPEGKTLKYRVYLRDAAWQDWVNEGEVAGNIDKLQRIEAIEIQIVDSMNVTYSAHVEEVGWQDYVESGRVAGITGKNKKVEAVKIKLNNPIEGASIEYSTYVENAGWQDFVADDQISGTTGDNLKLYGLKINLKNADGYTVQYRVHVQDIGWLDWVENGQIAGTENLDAKVEAIQVRVIRQEFIVPDKTPEEDTEGGEVVDPEEPTEPEEPDNPEPVEPEEPKEFAVQYISHVQDTGWEQTWLKDGETSGTTGKNKKVEAVQIKLANAPKGVSLKYRTYVESIGWQNAVKDGETSGTTGENLKIYAIRISLENTTEYSIQYRVHVEEEGWLDWTENGDIAGDIDNSKKIEAIEVKLVKKAKGEATVQYISHVQDHGWETAWVNSPNISGTIGDNKKIEAMKIKLVNLPADVSIKYSMNLDGLGWKDSQDGLLLGTLKQNRKVFGIKLQLENSDKYKIKYKVHVQDIGWLDWVEGGELAGLETQNKKIEAIQIKLVDINQKDPQVQYISHVQDLGWEQTWLKNGEQSGTTGQNKKVEAVQIKLADAPKGVNIKYSMNVEGLGWVEAKNGEIAGTVGENLKTYGLKVWLENTENYSVKYRVHVQDKGWLDWVKNGELAGLEAQNYKIEAIEVKIVEN